MMMREQRFQWKLNKLERTAKRKMNKKLLFNIGYWVMIIVVIVTCIILISYLKGNANECLADPIRFYSEKIGEKCTVFCGNMIAP